MKNLIHLKDIKKDQIFYEEINGLMIKMFSLEDGYESARLILDSRFCKQWKCKAVKLDHMFRIGSDQVEYVRTENLEDYAAKLYAE